MADPIVIDRPKISVTGMGNPKKVLALPEGQSRHLICAIYGTASGVKVRTVTDKAGNPQTFEPIVGQFEAVPADPMKVVESIDGKDVEVMISAVRSGVLYLPSGIHEQLAEPLKKEGARPIDFALEVYSVKATNAAGYTYEVKSLTKPAESDPLAAIRQAIQGKTKLLPAPKASPAKAA